VLSEKGLLLARHMYGHTKKRHTATGLSRTTAGQEDYAGTTAHARTSVFALGQQLWNTSCVLHSPAM